MRYPICTIALLLAGVLCGCDQLADRPGFPCDLLGALCAEDPEPEPEPDPCAPGAPPVLMAHYPFSGNADDESGHGNHGTVAGATLTTDRFGNPDAAYDFDGDDYLGIESHAFFNGMCSFTLSAWIYPIRFDRGNPIISKVTPNRDFTLMLLKGESGESQVAFWVPDGLFTVNAGQKRVSAQAWSHLAGIWDGNELRLYVDGDLAATHPTNGARPAWMGTLMQIGSMNHDEYFLGKIDDVRIYDGVLTDAQIQELYAGE